MTVCYFTICARNYLAYALTLRESLLAAQPDARFLIFVSDEPPETPLGDAEVIAARDLDLPDAEFMTFAYDVMEFSTAIKPSCFEHLFDVVGVDAAVYLDPDILVLSPLAAVETALAAGASAVVTPHLLRPLPRDGAVPATKDIADTGVYNFGFLALRNDAPARAYLRWWRRECAENCIVDIRGGRFVDQKFGDMLPSFVPKTCILRDPGYNVAYWNLDQRHLAWDEDSATIDGEVVAFVHLSGFDYDRPDRVSKHQNRFERAADLGLGRLFDRYRAALARNGHERFRAIPYAYGSLPDGRTVPKALRRYYRSQHLAGAPIVAFRDHADALNARAAPGSPLTRFMLEVWRLRPDLAQAFDPWTRRGRWGYLVWFYQHARNEGLATPPYMPTAAAPVAAAVATLRRRARDVLRRRCGGS